MPVYKSKSATKDGRCWFFKLNYTDNFNNQNVKVSKKYMTKTEAQKEERFFLNSLDKNKHAPEKMTIGELWDIWMEHQENIVRATTKRGYAHTKKYIEPLFNIKCVDLTLKNYNDWRKDLEQKSNLNYVSKNDKQKVFRALLNFGRKTYDFNFYKITSSFVSFANPNAIQLDHAVYSPEEFEKFLGAEDTKKFRVLWLTLYFCGLRIGEARGLQWKDIDWENKTIWINKQVQSIDNYTSNWYLADLKTPSSNRKLPMCDQLYNEMLEYYLEVKSIDNYSDTLFCFGSDYGFLPLGYSTARRRKRKIANLAGVKEIRLHDFRHSCASLLIHKNVPIPMVSKYMGHASITETLNTYTHMLGTDLGSVADTLSSINLNN